MATLSWRFAPMPSGQWAGAYIGGQAGGAWGNNSSAIYDSTAAPTQVVIVSDVRLKRDIAVIGRRNDGLGIYSFRYLWSDTVHVGVMAQEVALIHPEAVVRDPLSGYLAVDYGRLGPQ
jgi:Chaperone of endosialidase